MRAKPFAVGMRALIQALAIAAASLVLFVTVAPSSADDAKLSQVVPQPFSQKIMLKRQQWHAMQQPALTTDVLAAYAARQQKLKTFDGFTIVSPEAELTQQVLLGYIAKRRNEALVAIESIDVTDGPALTADVVSSYASSKFTPTIKLVKLADGEKLCLTQAIYHEARGESREGQLAVANVIINRAMSKKYPSTICGVVFQNADKGRYKCQFTFACDGRSDMGRERTAWNRSMEMAETAFREFQQGERPGVIPNSVLFYHTRAVAPNWSRSFHRVAAIGSHLFYATN